MNPSTEFASRRRRAGWIARQPAERSALDTLAGLTLWLTLLHATAGTGLGLVIGSLAL